MALTSHFACSRIMLAQGARRGCRGEHRKAKSAQAAVAEKARAHKPQSRNVRQTVARAKVKARARVRAQAQTLFHPHLLGQELGNNRGTQQSRAKALGTQEQHLGARVHRKLVKNHGAQQIGTKPITQTQQIGARALGTHEQHLGARDLPDRKSVV